jgi:hypothetical protein
VEHRTFNERGDRDLLFVMGFGDRIDGENERWFVDRLADAGYRVHAIQLPARATDFDRAYRRPVQRYHDDNHPVAVVSHSLGGLVAAHLTTDARRVYLAPWWGIYGRKFLTWEAWLVPRLPITTPILSIRTEPGDIGALVTDEQWERLPKRISPVFVAEIDRAQQARPPIDDRSEVFVSLRDTVVSLAAVGEAVPRDRIHLYEGGHQLYSSTGRREATAEVLAALAG